MTGPLGAACVSFFSFSGTSRFLLGSSTRKTIRILSVPDLFRICSITSEFCSGVPSNSESEVQLVGRQRYSYSTECTVQHVSDEQKTQKDVSCTECIKTTLNKVHLANNKKNNLSRSPKSSVHPGARTPTPQKTCSRGSA